MSTGLMSHREILQQTFGYSEYRPIQEEVIETVMEGKDGLVILPTGGGKSLCYQIPALARPGLSVVVSPLIALMDDQVIALQEQGVAAAALHSNVSTAQKRQIRAGLDSGTIKLLYMAPESLLNARFLAYLKEKQIGLIAIDEAHCISVWGNDFRPEYTRLEILKSMFPETPLLALTATADEATRADICKQLKMPEAKRFVASFERPNLTLYVRPGQRRFSAIRDFLQERPGQCGIIYCLSRKSTEKMAAKVNGLGFNAACYHAGMGAKERSEVQKKFQDDRIEVVCATIAFGMGIDKPNVRFVIHFNMPKNIESYYQEIGRAGRDGQPADTLLFYSWADISMLKTFVLESDGDDDFKRVQLAKLDRIWEFANASSCRTNLVLNYFGEYREEDCGHCDNCLNPPKLFDGTKMAQMALSAVVRTREQVGLNTLIDILRGSGKQEIRAKGYHEIKTFGVGRKLPYLDWKSYITQLINQGGLSIDYTQNGKLKTTPLSRDILLGKRKLMLAKFEKEQPKPKRAPKKEIATNELFEWLRNWRRTMSQAKGVPAYAVFSDATLKALSEEKPLTVSDLLEIEGIGEVKMEQYGKLVIEIIRRYIQESDKVKVKGQSHIHSLQLFREGKSVEQIAQERQLNPTTILGHLATLIEKGEELDVSDILPPDDARIIQEKYEQLGKPDAMRPVFEGLEERYDYGTIRLALASVKVL